MQISSIVRCYERNDVHNDARSDDMPLHLPCICRTDHTDPYTYLYGPLVISAHTHKDWYDDYEFTMFDISRSVIIRAYHDGTHALIQPGDNRLIAVICHQD